MQLSLTDTQQKSLLKETLIEVLEERRSLFQEIMTEAMEDIALARAIEEGERTVLVSREQVFKSLPKPSNC